jgi:hypothetical protein
MESSERIGINDIRLLFENDLRFLRRITIMKKGFLECRGSLGRKRTSTHNCPVLEEIILDTGQKGHYIACNAVLAKPIKHKYKIY